MMRTHATYMDAVGAEQMLKAVAAGPEAVISALRRSLRDADLCAGSCRATSVSVGMVGEPGSPNQLSVLREIGITLEELEEVFVLVQIWRA